jgi:hypothetical protein
MQAARLSVTVVLLVAAASWAYHRFVAYPYVAERHDLGDAQLSVLVGPSDWWSPLSLLSDLPLVYGSIASNTQVTLELTSAKNQKIHRVLLTRADVAADHLPLAVEKSNGVVVVSDVSRRFLVAIPYGANSTTEGWTSR